MSLYQWTRQIPGCHAVAIATFFGAIVYVLALYWTRPPTGYGLSDAAWLIVTGVGAIVPSCVLFSIVRRHASRLRWLIALSAELLASILLAALSGFIFESFVNWGLQSVVSAHVVYGEAMKLPVAATQVTLLALMISDLYRRTHRQV